jgi:hypothetical protein
MHPNVNGVLENNAEAETISIVWRCEAKSGKN